MKKIIFVLAITVLAPIFTPNLTSNIALAQEKVLWIDVRTRTEFEQDHLDNAIHIPYDEISTRIAAIAPSKHSRINLYCQTGRRAEIALHTLESMGYVSVQNLGGLSQLQKQGIK